MSQAKLNINGKRSLNSRFLLSLIFTRHIFILFLMINTFTLDISINFIKDYHHIAETIASSIELL